MSSDGSGLVPRHQAAKAASLKRANKNRPMEQPAKKPVPRFRDVIQAPKLDVRDPRFESLCGKYDEGRFKAAYNFIYNEQLPAERQRLQKLIKKEKRVERREELQKLVKNIDLQLQEERTRKVKEEHNLERKRREKEAVMKGKKPFYSGDAIDLAEHLSEVLRREDLIAKYKELKAAGKLEAFLAKRRKRNASKDHRRVPYRRTVEE
eukprot:SM000071S21144  [mRNA]  locus=s71:579798:581862:- [translate_table: standard]